jgi:hypothetical protein
MHCNWLLAPPWLPNSIEGEITKQIE